MIASTRDGAIVVIELQRQEYRNALDVEHCHALRAAAEEAVEDGARVIVITGQGTAFCAGADLNGVYGTEFLDALYGMLRRLTELPVPIIAAVNGAAIGAGTQLAMACDLRVADDKAKFGVPVARNGMAVDTWTIRTLAALAGTGVARRLMLTGETIDRADALKCGLADHHGSLKYARAWAHEIAGLAPMAIAHSKGVLNETFADDDAIEASFAAVWASADVREAAQARVERRTPVFEGR